MEFFSSGVETKSKTKGKKQNKKKKKEWREMSKWANLILTRMHLALRQKCTKDLLTQTGKVVIQAARTCADNPEDIKLPPEPTTCCMSGCANCVWIEYATEISKLLDGNSEKVREIVLNKITDPNLKMFLSLELRNIQHLKESDDKK